MADETVEEIKKKIAGLAAEHRALDAELHAMSMGLTVDQIQVQRMKRRKLALKDEIQTLEDQLIPDIIA